MRRNLVWVPKAAEIAREAGARLREFFAQGVETEYKGDVDLVTVADRTVEKLIRARLGEAFPEHGIYGEEGTRERMEGEFRWYVDPLDGTTNFAHGFPQFCVSMGLEHAASGHEGRTKMERWWPGSSTIRMRDELFTAERGQGAQLNGKPCEVSRIAGAGRVAAGHRLSQPQAPRRAPTFTSIRSSRCARTECGGPVRPRWIWPTWPAGAWKPSGSSI